MKRPADTPHALAARGGFLRNFFLGAPHSLTPFSSQLYCLATDMPKRLPNLLYELSLVGSSALSSLVITHQHKKAGLSRVGFILAQMDSALTLPCSIYAIAQVPLRRSKAAWRRNLAAVPGFCWVRLLKYEYVTPAICSLGAYPAASDVAALFPFFRDDIDLSHWSSYASGRCHGLPVVHISYSPRSLWSPIVDRLLSLRTPLVGSSLPHRKAGGTSGRPPRSRNGANQVRRDRGSSEGFSAPPHPSNPFLPNRPPDGPVPPDMFRLPRGGRAQAERAPRPFPLQPYSTNPSDRRRGSPSAQAHAWRSATRDDFDDAIDSLKLSLPNLPKPVADSLWNDFLSWLLTFPAGPKFSRTASIPDVAAKFRSLYDPALAAAKEAAESAALAEADSHDDLVSKGLRLSRLGKLITSLEKDLVDPPPSRTLAAIEAELAAAHSSFTALDEEIDSLEAGAVPPPSVIDDPFESAADFIPLESPAVRPWPQENFEEFISRTEPLFPPPEGKTPLDSLVISMKVQTDSKILLPRPLELYSESEINSAKPKNRSPWYNRHEDSLEAVKSWPLETFRHVYSKPGFHFMIARTAQSGAQSRDPKLSSLRSKLSSRWGCVVDISAMDPRQDWMFCTIPDVSGPRSEILTTSLMRLSEGNASYIVRHFAPISTVRDLVFTIRGSRDDANSVYNQLRKRLLEFESCGVNLGWRVLGVRKTAVPSQYRGTFILDSADVFWPWSFSFDHNHGSVNPPSPLLNFDPPWYARKPYACQVCYSSSHPTYKCALQFVRLGGVQIVSHSSMEAMKVKKAAKRLYIIDKSLVPKKPAPMAPPPVPVPAPARLVPFDGASHSPAPLSPIAESPHVPSMTWQESLASFIASKLSRHVGYSPGRVPVSEILRLATCGSLAGTLDSLEEFIPSISSWSRADALREFSTWRSSQTVLESLQSEDPMSLGPSAAPSVRAPSPAPLFFERSRLFPSFGFRLLNAPLLAPADGSPALLAPQQAPAPNPLSMTLCLDSSLSPDAFFRSVRHSP